MKYLFLFIWAGMIGCTTVKRYKSIENTATDVNHLVSIDLFGTKVDAAKEDEKTKSLWDLQAQGQAALIKALAARNSNDDKFTTALNAKYLKEKEKVITDYTTKDVRLVFSISKKRDYLELSKNNPTFQIGDRIEYLQFDITIPDTTNLNFIKWNKFTTEYATIDVADVSFNQSLEVDASTGLTSTASNETTVDSKKTSGSNSLAPSVTAKGTTGKTEAQKVRYRYVALNGKISDKQISIEQEGMREIDLAGNVIADVNLKFDENPETLATVEGYKAADGSYNTPDKLKIVLYTAMVPALATLPATINANLTYQYAYRHIAKGEKTFYEWDDKIEYLKGVGTKIIPLFKKKDYLPAFFNIARIGQDAIAANNRTRIVLEDVNSGDITEMIFSSLGAAQEFSNWLIGYNPAAADINKPIVAGTHKLLLRANGTDSPLTKPSFNSIKSNMQVLAYYR
jgi:hypothetical protein